MKKIYALMLAAACAICLAGCVKEILGADEAVAPATEMIICGTMGDLVEDGSQAPADTPDTRTQVRNTKEVWWNSGDQIAVFMSTSPTANKFTSTLTSGMSKTSYFSGTLKKTGSKYYVGYPSGGAEYSTSSDGTLSLRVPSSQTAVSGSFSSNTLPSYGSFTSSSTDFTMKPAAGGLKFHVSRDDIKSVKFEGNNGEKVAGTVTVAKLSKTPDVSRGSSGSTSITLKRSSGNLEKDKNYFIVITPGSLSKGFTITLTTEDGESLVVTSTKSRTIKAGVFGTLSKALDEYASATPSAVDLGLSVKWANWNYGAGAPEEAGERIAWGETRPKTEYSWSNYVWCNGSANTLEYYNFDSSYGSVDYRTVLLAMHDAASKNWLGDWRIPTKEEMQELIDGCSWEWTSLNGVDGYKVSGTRSGYTGKSIFLPACDALEPGSGYLWSRNLSDVDPLSASCLGYSKNGRTVSGSPRYKGLSIRPVSGKWVEPESVSVPATLSISIGDSVPLEVSITPSDASDKSCTIVSSDKSIVDTDGTNILGVSVGSATVSVYTSNGKKAECTVSVTNAEPQYVDLGLPSGTLWATFNLGAGRPQHKGHYYAWGETEPKSDYSWSTYKWCDGTKDGITKYYYSADNADYKYILDYEDDAARAQLGSEWRIPYSFEWDELLNDEYCEWEWESSETTGGAPGYRVRSKMPGYTNNSIFLPATGNPDDSSDEETGYYWAAEIDTRYSGYYASCALSIRHHTYSMGDHGTGVYEDKDVQPYSRYVGMTIRPVFGNRVLPTGVSVLGSITMREGNYEKVKPAVIPSNAEFTMVWGFTSSNPKVAYYDSYYGSVVALSVGSATLAFHTANGISATCYVAVNPEAGAGQVDLGLSVKWASVNIGAYKAEDYGNYYAWGETKAKSSYGWDNYLWCDGSAATLKKYNTNSSYGTVDYRTVMDPDDDAALLEWGGNWRIPTSDEISELRNNCTWTWTSRNGINGYEVKGKKSGYTNNSIFLPAAGYYEGGDRKFVGSSGRYWSRSPYSGNQSYSLRISSDDYYTGNDERAFGSVIRPVYDKWVPIQAVRVPVSVSMKKGGATTVDYSVYPDNASVKSVIMVSDDNSTVRCNGSRVEGVKGGHTDVTVYANNGVNESFIAVVYAEPEAVDLGLSVKWSSVNLGASKPEDPGCYYAWAELSPKKYYSNWSYKWIEDSHAWRPPCTRYVPSTDYETYDGKKDLSDYNWEDDAARANLGGQWRLPTTDELRELRDNCTWQWYDNYNGSGIAGYKVSGKKSGYTGKFIFLPVTGYNYYDSVTSLKEGYYWSSEVYESLPNKAWCLRIKNSDWSAISLSEESRTDGMAIRPVTN
ncbi:MAG: Ig-like domain-containing protein [Bacteroidales bacterium]|nr:Ig-like domain-containing protein [Bacteroidales bacterium]